MFELQLSRIRRLTLNSFRNYQQASLNLAGSLDGASDIIALVGPNGAGKTNILEALSLFSPGRGLRGVKWPELRQRPAQGADASLAGFAVSADIETGLGPRRVGAGLVDGTADKKEFRLDGGRARSANTFADFLSFVWLTPQQDGLFRGAAEERRRFLDQLATALDASYAAEWSAYQNSARQRLKLLKDAGTHGAGAPDPAWLAALEDSMARHGTTVAVARRAMVRQLNQLSQHGHDPFPGARLAIRGLAEEALDRAAAVEVEEQLRALWREERDYDQRYKRTHSGPHRSDLLAWHSDHGMPAQDCSTGEQKAMLVAIVLSHAQLVENRRMVRPILLLDEATAHLDPARREALLSVLSNFGGQCWLTGTDIGAFPGLTALGRLSRVFEINSGQISR